jgi:hypothetical protein
MSNKQPDEFYIGYLPRAPEKSEKFLRKVILALLFIAVIVAVILVIGQNSFYPSVFEFGIYREFEGVIKEKPYPVLWVQRPGEAGALPGYSQYYLVSFGKFGALEAVREMDGKRVKLQGSLIYRDNQTMIEIQEGLLEVIDDQPGMLTRSTWNRQPGKTLGTFQLTGEIVDSKCFFGVMNPGNLKTHKSCAIRCISGGIPPVLVVKNKKGLATYFLLVSEEGKTVNREVLPLVADPVEITGEVIQYENLLVLKADPQTYRKLN